MPPPREEDRHQDKSEGKEKPPRAGEVGKANKGGCAGRDALGPLYGAGPFDFTDGGLAVYGTRARQLGSSASGRARTMLAPRRCPPAFRVQPLTNNGKVHDEHKERNCLYFVVS